MRLLFLSAALLAAATVSAQAPAGTSERALARSLFHQGIECLDAGDLPCAAEHFARSQDLRPSPVVAYNLASVLAQLGRVVHAAELLRWVRRSPNANAEVREAAGSLLDEVTPRIAHWVLEVDGTPTGARFFLDGRALPEQAVGVRAPIDPGEHRVEARRGETTVVEASFSVAERGQAQVTLDVPAPRVPSPAEAAAAEAPADDSQLTVPGDEVDRANADERNAHRRKRRRRGLGIGLGLAAVAAAIVLGVVLHSPDPAQPIPGNLSPAVVEIGD